MMDDLARAEWDFSSCPRSEIFTCWFYEYARESELLKERVLQWRSKALGNTIEDFLQLTGGKPDSRFHPFHAATYPYLPSWPLAPYLAAQQKDREAWHRSLFPTPEKEALAYLLEAHFWTRDLNENLMEAKERTGRYALRYGHLELVILQIDWYRPDSELVEMFSAFVESRRPGDITPFDDRGQNDPVRKKANELRYLSARRLLRHMTIGDAIAFTEEELGKPLYKHCQEWTNNSKKAAEIRSGLEKIMEIKGRF
jgi:hypothetical protein